MDRLDEFAIFVRIVEESSLVRAASRLRRSPPAVTRALASLEARLGVRLIDRTTRRLAPTEAGRVLYDKARIVLGDYEAATLGVREAPVRGLLRVAAPVQFGRRHVASIVTAFLDSHADAEVELLLNDRNVDLIDEAIDVAVRIGSLADSGLTARAVGEVRRLWVASPGYLESRGVPRVPEDLVGHEAVLGTFRTAPSWISRVPTRSGEDCRPAADGRHRDAAWRRARGTRHRAVPVVSGCRRSRGRSAGAPAARVRAAGDPGASADQGPNQPRAQGRCLSRFCSAAVARAARARARAGQVIPAALPRTAAGR